MCHISSIKFVIFNFSLKTVLVGILRKLQAQSQAQYKKKITNSKNNTLLQKSTKNLKESSGYVKTVENPLKL